MKLYYFLKFPYFDGKIIEAEAVEDEDVYYVEHDFFDRSAVHKNRMETNSAKTFLTKRDAIIGMIVYIEKRNEIDRQSISRVRKAIEERDRLTASLYNTLKEELR